VRQGFTHQRDRAVQVLLLPPVYGLFALDSALCALAVMWGAVVRDDVDSLSEWNEHVRLRDEIYVSSFEVAELYEAWALWCFGKVCVQYVGLHLGTGDAARELFRPLQRITMLGISTFVSVYVVKSAYLLILSVLRSPPFELHVCRWGKGSAAENDAAEASVACGWERFFSGAGFTASSIAIYNMFTFEHSLEPFLMGFKPRLKFLTVKLLLSLAFIQDFVIQVASHLLLGLSREQRQLLYSSLICIEVLVIACLQVPAWNARDSWYDGDPALSAQAALSTQDEHPDSPLRTPVTDFRTWEAERYSVSGRAAGELELRQGTSKAALLAPSVQDHNSPLA